MDLSGNYESLLNNAQATVLNSTIASVTDDIKVLENYRKAQIQYSNKVVSMYAKAILLLKNKYIILS